MKWMELSRWMLVAVGLIAAGMCLWRMRKVKKESQYDAIERDLITIRFWIILIFIILAMDKLGIILAVIP